MIISFYPRILTSALRLAPLTFLINQIDHPVTVSQEHNLIPGEAIMISGRTGNNAEESGNRFAKEKSISGKPKSIFAKIKNTFAKIKNTISFSGNRFAVNILQETVNKLKEDESDLKNLGNRMIFVETFRKNGEPIFNFGLRIADFGMGKH